MELRMGCAHLNDEEFVEAFENCRLSGEMFHHADHVRLAWLYLKEYGESGAEERLLQGIRKMANHHGAPEKFLYTTTVAWVRLVAAARAAGATNAAFPEWIAAHTELLDKDFVLRHYTKERLDSAAARSGWLEPDVAPLS